MSENVYGDQALQKYLGEIAIYEPLSRQEEHEYAIRAKNKDPEAINILIRSNLKFVVKIAAKYTKRGLSLAELISEGNMGLIRAIEKFDPDKNIKLISYAVWWIKQRIMYALAEKTTTIRIPVGKSNIASKVKKAKQEIKTREGRVASISEIMEHTNLDREAIKKISYQIVNIISMDSVISKNSESKLTLRQFIVDEYHLTPQDDYYHERLLNKIFDNIYKLPERSQYIIQKYFGLNGEKPMNFAAIARIINISRERVRQIHNESIQKIYSEIKDDYNTNIDCLIRESI